MIQCSTATGSSVGARRSTLERFAAGQPRAGESPAHDLNSNSLVPVAFGLETVVFTDGSRTVTTSTNPATAKGSSAPNGGPVLNSRTRKRLAKPGPLRGCERSNCAHSEKAGAVRQRALRRGSLLLGRVASTPRPSSPRPPGSTLPPPGCLEREEYPYCVPEGCPIDVVWNRRKRRSTRSGDLPESSQGGRRRAWLAFQRALDPLGTPRPLPGRARERN